MASGLEKRDGTYFIATSRLWETSGAHGWVEQIADKSWADMDDFKTALLVARGYFGGPVVQ